MSSVMMSASVSKAMNAFSAEVIRACALKYGFDGDEAMRELSVCVATEGKKTKAKKETGLSAAKKAATREMPSIPLPFTGAIREDCCLGVKQNHGLYTQCFSAPGESGLCKGCSKQASKNASGEPDCGLIAKRVMQGSEYRDAKGRAPVHYTKVMKKQKLTEEQVQAEAAKFGIEIEASHFAIPETKRGRPKKATTSDTDSDASSSAADASGEKKARGRPKKAAKVVEVNATEDLFASLMQQAQSASPRPSAAGGGSAEEMSDVSSNSGSESDSESKVSKKKTKKSKEESEEELAEKAAKFLAKEAEKEKKAAAKAAEKEAEKVKKAAEKEAEKAKKLAEKEAEKVKKAAEKEAEKAKKLAEKEAEKVKKAAKEEKPKKEKKASKKKAEEPVKPQAEEPVADLESESEEEDTSEAEEPVVAVKKFEHEGVTYLKSSDGVLYDAKTQSVVGKWNETTKSIDVYDGESESEEEESDDEDDE